MLMYPPQKSTLAQRWELAPNPTAGLYPTMGMVMWSYNGKIYTVGGEGPKPAGVNNAFLRIFDPATQGWTATTTGWFSRSNSAAVVLNDMAYVIGGSDIGNSNVVNRYNLLTNVWATVAIYPQSLNSISAIAVGSTIYAFGGTNGPSAYNSAYRYDVPTNRWIKLADMLEGVSNGQAFVLSDPDIIYYAGGITSTTTDKIWQYRISTNTWAIHPAKLPLPLYGMTICQVGKVMCMFGGNNGGLKVNNNFYTIDSDTLTFSKLAENTPIARYGHGAAAIGSDLYVYGGFNGSYLGDMWLRK